MPDVTVSNPTVQIDLSEGASTTVPSGERWKVSLMGVPGGSGLQINGASVTVANSTDSTAHIRTDLFGGDEVRAVGFHIRIRGYRVD
jgi:L-ascorbate metabolism protein UlaG (beta-lactamase superfamily)